MEIAKDLVAAGAVIDVAPSPAAWRGGYQATETRGN
jgi:hypothetical protein